LKTKNEIIKELETGKKVKHVLVSTKLSAGEAYGLAWGDALKWVLEIKD